MRVTKKIKSDLEIIDNLQRITGYKLTKKTKGKSPPMILLQKISNNEYNNPIKVQLLKSKNNNQNTNSNLYNNMNITSYSLNKPKISINKNDISYSKNKIKEEFEIKNDINKLKASLIITNKNRILDSPKSKTRYKNTTTNIISHSPIKKESNLDIINSNMKTNHQILNVLSKNFAYNKKKPNGQILSPASAFQPSRKNTSDTNNTNSNNKNLNSNNEYGTKTYFGKDNYSVNSSKNYNKNINSPKTPSYITDIDSKSAKNNLNNYNTDIKLEDLILFEERLNDIIIAINQGNLNNVNNKYDIGASNECYEFFVFYFNNSSIKYKFPFFFQEENRLINQSAINLKLFIIMITYHLSLNPNLLLKLIDDLKFIFSLLKQNLYLCIKKLMLFYGEAFILQNEMYFKNFNYILSRNGLNNLTEKEIKDIIYKNCSNIVKNISNILNLYKIIGDPFYFDFNEIFCFLSQITEKEINNYFCTYLFGAKKPKNLSPNNNNKNNSLIQFKQKIILHNITLDTDVELFEYKKNRIHPPYITSPSQKKYTLVLDLNNTLINYEENISSSNDTFMLRPGLLSFLNTLKPIYELISFTNESKELSDKYLKEIETNKKYFDFNLYKEHNILIGRNLVKDISKIGRDMKKIIIVDKLYENIKATPHNGILIKPYFGQKDGNDTVLFELKKLLILVHKMGYEDIRTAIKNYENDIKYKITCENYC